MSKINVLVKGAKGRYQISSKRYQCDKPDCTLDHLIEEETNYVRVKMKDGSIETYHRGCFLEEFTDASQHFISKTLSDDADENGVSDYQGEGSVEETAATHGG